MHVPGLHTAERRSHGQRRPGASSPRALPGWDINASYTFAPLKDADGERLDSDNPDRLFRVFTTYRMTGRFEGLTLGGGVAGNSEGDHRPRAPERFRGGLPPCGTTRGPRHAGTPSGSAPPPLPRPPPGIGDQRAWPRGTGSSKTVV